MFQELGVVMFVEVGRAGFAPAGVRTLERGDHHAHHRPQGVGGPAKVRHLAFCPGLHVHVC